MPSLPFVFSRHDEGHSMQDRTQDDGFTLIELLVVMIIIGILAAIAIPSFLAQRDKGYQTAIRNDLKTVSIAEESYATDNDGAFADDQPVSRTSVLGLQGALLSPGVTVEAYGFVSGATRSYCVWGGSTRTSAAFKLLSADNKPTAATTNKTAASVSDYASCIAA